MSELLALFLFVYFILPGGKYRTHQGYVRCLFARTPLSTYHRRFQDHNKLTSCIMSVDDETSGWQLTESDPGVFTYVCIHPPRLYARR